MAGHSGPKRPSRELLAVKASIEKLAPLARRAMGQGEETFVGPPAPLPAVRKMSGFGMGLQSLLDAADEFQRMRAALEKAQLQSETARSMSRKKWSAHDQRKAEALRHVASKTFPNRTAAAWEIVDFMEKTFKQSVSWKRAYMWLPPVGRRRKGE
jgi:hypothetical protein